MARISVLFNCEKFSNLISAI